MRRDFLSKHPSSSAHSVAIVVGIGICAELLGVDWLKRNIDAKRPPAADFFPRLVTSVDEDAHFRWEHRVIDLASLLYEGQDLEGFAAARSEFGKRTLRGVAAELRVAHLLRGSGHRPRFVARTGDKGHDYDIEVPLQETSVAVEVKAKDEGTPLNESTIMGTIRDARKQLPKEGPGVVVLSLPEAWTNGPEVDGAVLDAVAKALRKSQRINSVVLLWEAMLQVAPTSRAFATCFMPIHNALAKRPVEGMEGLLRAVAPGAPIQGGRPTYLRDLEAPAHASWIPSKRRT